MRPPFDATLPTLCKLTSRLVPRPRPAHARPRCHSHPAVVWPRRYDDRAWSVHDRSNLHAMRCSVTTCTSALVLLIFTALARGAPMTSNAGYTNCVNSPQSCFFLCGAGARAAQPVAACMHPRTPCTSPGTTPLTHPPSPTRRKRRSFIANQNPAIDGSIPSELGTCSALTFL